jgi:hypothetical protein
MLRLLLEAHTVQNFSLKGDESAVFGGGMSAWPSSAAGTAFGDGCGWVGGAVGGGCCWGGGGCGWAG